MARITLKTAKSLGYTWQVHPDESHTLEVFKDGEPAFQVASDEPLFSLLIYLNEDEDLDGDKDVRDWTDEQKASALK